MKCPYITQTATGDTTHYVYDEDGNVKTVVYGQRTLEAHTDCIKEQCAAWEDGKCKRAQ